MRTPYDEAALPDVVDRATFEELLASVREREKALTREYDALAAARRRLPMVEVDGSLPIEGPAGTTTLLAAFEGRRQLLAYYFMWHAGHEAREQCPGCTWCCAHLAELSYLHSRDVSVAVFAQEGSFAESDRYREFMGWTMPWYAVEASAPRLLSGRTVGRMHLVAYVRDGDRVFETWWTTSRGVEVMDNSYSLLDLTVWGRQEEHEDSPAGWPRPWSHLEVEHILERDGRPIPQWSRIEAGHSDELGTSGR